MPKLMINRSFPHPHCIGMEDAEYLPGAPQNLRPQEHPDVIRERRLDHQRNAPHFLCWCYRFEGLGTGMTKMVMMWLFGVPVSVLMLFMIFGVL